MASFTGRSYGEFIAAGGQQAALLIFNVRPTPGRRSGYECDKKRPGQTVTELSCVQNEVLKYGCACVLRMIRTPITEDTATVELAREHAANVVHEWRPGFFWSARRASLDISTPVIPPGEQPGVKRPFMWPGRFKPRLSGPRDVGWKI
jgi:hypothetical protein